MGIDGLAVSRRAWLIWAVGICAYMLGVFHRSSLAVAGLQAEERFGISATQLGSFVVLQLAVYALLQVPVGVMVDRFGSRSVLLAGIAAMSLGQVMFALAESYPAALIARVFVGLGDATAFVCLLRLVNAWFAPRRIPLVTQITGPMGQIGSIMAAAPMSWALLHLGWERSYLLAALAGGGVALAVLLVVSDEPARRIATGTEMSWRSVGTSVRSSWSQPGTRLGFWVHFSQHFSATTLALVWGFPYFVLIHDTSEHAASLLLTVLLVAVICTGPAIGWLIGAHPRVRSGFTLGTIALVAGVWTVVLLWPQPAPLWLLFGLVAVLGATAPVAMIGFDFVRDANPPERLASATGLVNQGGFVASLACILLVGVILDVVSPGSAYSPGAFTAAFCVQYVFWAVAAVQIWRLSRRLGAGQPRRSHGPSPGTTRSSGAA